MTIFSRFEELSSNFYNFLTDFNPLEALENLVENTGSVIPITFLIISLAVLLTKSAES